jgi:predicted GNAT family acetyltransferase
MNGYAAGEMKAYFDRGAFSCTVYKGDDPISTCFCFPNFGKVWEIAGVHTVQDHRRQGYARKVVETASSVLLGRDYMLRYQMHESNVPSIQLAESVGLERFLTTEHFLTHKL